MKNHFKSLSFFALFAVLLFASSASAQEVTRLPQGTRHAVSFDGGLESAFVVRAAYGYQLGMRALPDARFVARFTWPVVTPDFGDWAIDLGLRATVARYHDLRLAFAVGPVFRMNDNDLFTAFAMGVSTTMLAGFESERWGLSLEAGYEQLFSTYVHQSTLYRETFDGGAKSGFYALSGSTARVGLRGGGRIGPLEIFLRGGLDATGVFHALNPPFYATLGVGFAL